MLHDQDMPHYLWEKACSTIVYIQNRVPHKVLGKITPKEYFMGKKPDVSRFRIFQSLLYYHIKGATCSKLDQTGERWYLVGYSVKPQRHIVYLFQGP